MCITTYRDNTLHAMLANQGTLSIWISYAEGYPTGTYQVFKPKTKTIILTQDVIFLQKSHGEYSKDENLSWSQWVVRGWMMMRSSKQFQ